MRAQAPYPQVVLFGDSLFEGSVDVQNGFSFFAAVQRREWTFLPSTGANTEHRTFANRVLYGKKDCSRRLDVINRGFSGYNTSQALEILEKVFPKPSPEGPKLKYLVSSSLLCWCEPVISQTGRRVCLTLHHPNNTARPPRRQ